MQTWADFEKREDPQKRKRDAILSFKEQFERVVVLSCIVFISGLGKY